MPRLPYRDLWRRPGLLGALLFAATMALGGALAWQAVRAAGSHRAAAEASLAHHATIAAWRFARDARNWVGWGMGLASDGLQREIDARRMLPGPDVLRRLLAEKECDCVSAAFGRTVFRVAASSAPTIIEEGEPLSARTREALLAAGGVALTDTVSREGPRVWRILPPGEPRLSRPRDLTLLWTVRAGRDSVRVVYGMVVDPEQVSRPLRGARDDVQFFPPSLVPDSLADSLVRIVVAGGNGEAIFESGPRARGFIGTDTLGHAYGDLIVTAHIDSAAARLLVAGLPASRAPTILALLALSLGVGGVALLLVHREQKLARLREDFVSGVSHELRTPLTQIRVLSELLVADSFRTDDERSRAKRVIHRESLRLSNLVDNVLTFTRLKRAGGAPPQGAAPVPDGATVSVGDVAHELLESFTPLLHAHEARLEVEAHGPTVAAGDRDSVSCILRNLLENAIKYGPRGQTIRMTVTGDQPAGVVRATVDDQGPGIPESERARIWQPYYRLDRDRGASTSGSGLGLAVVAELVRALGGRAWVDDAPGTGARFIVELPAR